MNHNRKGAAVVEFAIVAPVFILFVLGIIEAGRYMMIQTMLTNAAREGARTATLDGNTAEDVVRAIKSEDHDLLFGVRNWRVTCSPANPNEAKYGQVVTVTVAAPLADNSWLPIQRFLVGRSLTSTCSMRHENR